MLNWTNDKDTMDIESKIADRAIATAKIKGIKLDKLNLVMDIDATHNNGNPIDFKHLLEADDYNFFHDIFGIQQNLNRKTGKLENCFVPRFSVKRQ